MKLVLKLAAALPLLSTCAQAQEEAKLTVFTDPHCGTDDGTTTYPLKESPECASISIDPQSLIFQNLGPGCIATLYGSSDPDVACKTVLVNSTIAGDSCFNYETSDTITGYSYICS